MTTLADYREIAPKGTVDFIGRLADRVKGRRLVSVSATRYGAGVPRSSTAWAPCWPSSAWTPRGR